jgi:integrase
MTAVYTGLRELRAGLRKIRFHDLHRIFASLMLHNREPIMRVSAALGHASPAITLSV